MDENNKQSVTNLEMATLLISLPAHLEISDAYELLDHQEGRWWESQREHLISWFFSRTCKGGIPGFKVKEPRLEASKTYGRLKNPAALIWLAEALGISPVTLKKACGAGLANIDKLPTTRCAAITDIIPWKDLEPLARKLIDDKGICIKPGKFSTEN